MTYRLRNLGLAIALAAVAVLLVFYYVSQERGRLQEDQELVPVWVAAKDIPVGHVGRRARRRRVPDAVRGRARPGFARRAPRPGGRRHQGRRQPDLQGRAGEPLRFKSEAEQGIRAQLTGTLRAVQVPGNEHQLLAGTLIEGDRVDVVGTWNVPETATNHVSRTILRDILVLEPAIKADVQTKITEDADKGLSVKLALTDAQEQKLFWVVPERRLDAHAAAAERRVRQPRRRRVLVDAPDGRSQVAAARGTVE